MQNADSSIDLIDDVIVTFWSDVHSLKVYFSMDFKDDWIDALKSDVHCSKAFIPI